MGDGYGVGGLVRRNPIVTLGGHLRCMVRGMGRASRINRAWALLATRGDASYKGLG